MSWVSKEEHKANFEKLASILRQPGATNIEKLENSIKNNPNHGINDHLEMSASGMVYLTMPIEDMSREEAVKALVGVSKVNATNREDLMKALMDKADLPQDTYRMARRSQLGTTNAEDLDAKTLIASLDDPDPWGFKMEKSERSAGGNEITIDGQRGVFADIGVATLKHDNDLKRALKCAVQGDESGLRQALRGSMYVRNNYSSQLKEIASGRLHVTPETLKFLGITDQSAGSVVIDNETGDARDQYSGQFNSTSWWNWK